MTIDNGHLHDMAEMDEDFFRMAMKHDNLTLADMEKVTKEESENRVVYKAHIPKVDKLKDKSRRVKRKALKEAYKRSRKGHK